MDVTPPDSAALRSHGAQLRSAADDVRALAERLDRRVEAADFRGPAGDRFRAGMSERLTRLRRVAADLEDLSSVVQQPS
jgi:hypothetical protein